MLKSKIALNPDFMTHFKTLNAIYSKVLFCDLVTFCFKPFNLGLLFSLLQFTKVVFDLNIII